MCFFLLTLFVLKRFSEKVFKSLWWTLIVCAFYGFSIGAVTTVVFIRMYMLLTFASVLLCYINYSIWKEIDTGAVSIKSKLITYGLLLFSIVFGMLTQYYFLIFAFFTCAMFWICLLINKYWKSVIEYSVVILLGLTCSYLIWPEVYNDVFNGYRGNEAFKNLKDISSLKSAVISYAKIISQDLFGNHLILWFGCAGVMLLIFIVLRFIQITLRKNRQNEWEISIQRKKLEITKSKKLEITITVTKDIMFLIAILISTAMYLLLIAWIAPFEATATRYIFNVYPIIGLLFVYGVKCMTGLFSASKIMRCIILAFGFVVITLGYTETGVRCIYVGAEAKLDTIQQYSDLPAITITQGNRRMLSCVNCLYYRYSDGVYLLDKDDIEELSDVLAEKKADDYILYIDSTIKDIEAELEKVIDLTPMEVNYEFLFTTGVSSVYLIHQ